jgi:hypothetical protein
LIGFCIRELAVYRIIDDDDDLAHNHGVGT